MSSCSKKDKLSNKTDYRLPISKSQRCNKKFHEDDQIQSSPDRDRPKKLNNDVLTSILTLTIMNRLSRAYEVAKQLWESFRTFGP